MYAGKQCWRKDTPDSSGAESQGGGNNFQYYHHYQHDDGHRKIAFQRGKNAVFKQIGRVSCERCVDGSVAFPIQSRK